MIGGVTGRLQLQIAESNRARSRDIGALSGAPSNTAGSAIEALGYAQVLRNVHDALAGMSAADTFLGQIGDAAQRMRELAVFAASDTISPEGRAAIGVEVDSLVATMRHAVSGGPDDIRHRLFSIDSPGTAVTVQSGSETSDRIELPPVVIHLERLMAAAPLLNGSLQHTDAATSISAIDAFLGDIGQARGAVGAAANRLDSVDRMISRRGEDLAASYDEIDSAMMLFFTTRLAKDQILADSSTAMLAQANASRDEVSALLRLTDNALRN